MRLARFPLNLVVLACGLASCSGQASPGGFASSGVLPPLSDSTWAALVQSLSEPAGYFDTDNLISNERSFLHVLEPLRELPRGAYLGVGPDQNFSYMTAARPSVAFLVDIRRDNLLHHLLLRSLLALADTRVEYLTLLHGRAPTVALRRWDDRTLEQILAHIDSQPVDSAAVRGTDAAIDSILRTLPCRNHRFIGCC